MALKVERQAGGLCDFCAAQLGYGQSENCSISGKPSATLKRLLNPGQRKLCKAGLLDSGLQFTALGKEILFNLLSEKYEAELVKEAEAIIAERKENCA